MGPVPGQVIEDSDGVISHGRNGAKKWPPVAGTHAEVIIVAAAMVGPELIHLRSPNRSRHPKSHDEEHRRPLLPESLIGEPRPGLSKSHAQRPTHTRADTDAGTDADTGTGANTPLELALELRLPLPL